MGVEELDQDHKRLLHVAEVIAERVDDPDTDPKQWPHLVREGMKYMEGYYEGHIQREEAYMRQKGYAHFDSHHQVHEELKQMVHGYIESQVTENCQLDNVLKLLGATYGWQMLHIAVDDMAILGRGALAQPEETEITDETVTHELDLMLGGLMHFEPRTRVISHRFDGENLNSAVCQKITYNVDGTDITLVVGLEGTLLRHAIQTFWGEKVKIKEVDKAHQMLLQWCLSAFTIGFWRDMIVRFTHDKPCVLKETSPLDMVDARQMLRTITPRQSTLYETTRGRLFVVTDAA
jgi:hemerythrin-like metal-binding protein